MIKKKRQMKKEKNRQKKKNNLNYQELIKELANKEQVNN